MARPSKITEAVLLPDGRELTYSAAIVMALRRGAYIEEAALAVNISRSTVYNWLARGEEHRDPGVYATGKRQGEPRPIPKDERPYVEFLHAVETARATVVNFHISNIMGAAQGRPAVYERDADGRVVFDRTGKPIVLQPARPPDPRASEWWLERTDPKRFGRRIEVDTDPEDRQPAPFDRQLAAEVQAAFEASSVPVDAAGLIAPGLGDG